MSTLFALREKVTSIPDYDTNLDCDLRQVNFPLQTSVLFSIR